MRRCLWATLLTCTLGSLSACGGGASGAGGVPPGISPKVATHFSVTVPTEAAPSTFFTVTVVALDDSNNRVFGYAGTVHFTSSDPHALLSVDSPVMEGTITFSAVLTSLGSQTITATDENSPKITGVSDAIDVATDPNQHGFQATGNMGTGRAAHTATLLADGKVLVTGGFDGTGDSATAEIYDPTSGTFNPTGSMTIGRSLHTATLLDHGPAITNGQVLITGGMTGLATAELFDPATGTFTATGSMSEPRSEHTATLLANGMVLVTGGSPDNSAELFDPATGTFSATGGVGLAGLGWGSTATLLSDGTVLVAGGRDAESVFDGFASNGGALFNAASGTFTDSGGMSQPRYWHAAALLKTGMVLITGGINGGPTPYADLFDPKTRSFSPTANMQAERAQHTATSLNDGTVLVAGGSSQATPGGSLSTAEVFDPTTSQFTLTGPMSTGRYGQTATRLNNGTVLVAGGYGSAGNTAELYK